MVHSLWCATAKLLQLWSPLVDSAGCFTVCTGDGSRLATEAQGGHDGANVLQRLLLTSCSDTMARSPCTTAEPQPPQEGHSLTAIALTAILVMLMAHFALRTLHGVYGRLVHLPGRLDSQMTC